MLRILGVSKSGYYAWLNRKPSESHKRCEKLKEEILDIYEASHHIYGSPKITVCLSEKGYSVSQKTVFKLMKKMGLKPHYIKPWVRTTTNCDFSTKLQNVLERDFNPTEPNAVWCTDITYIPTSEGFVYLTSIMDLYSRKIIAWTLSESMESEIVLQCLRQAIEENQTSKPRVIHSDRGIQFVCKLYQEICGNMTRSYSRKGNPWDNACIEAFHSLIKCEWLDRIKIRNYNHAYTLVFEYIETFYNTVRIHSSLDYLSPNEYIKKFYTHSN